MAPLVMDKEYEFCPCCSRLIRRIHRSTNCNFQFNLEPNESIEENKLKSIEPVEMINNFDISRSSIEKLKAYILNLKERSQRSHRSTTHNVTRSFETISRSDVPFGSLLLKSPRLENDYFIQNTTNRLPPIYQNQQFAEVANLAKVFQTVEACPWFWGDLNNKEASNVLQDYPVGYFLLRNSSDRRFLFSLSLMTNDGPYSIRIGYSNGRFQYCSINEVPRNQCYGQSKNESNSVLKENEYCVIQMILSQTSYLIAKPANIASSSGDTNNIPNAASRPNAEQNRDISLCSWKNRVTGNAVQVALNKPRYKNFPSLKELSRSTINQNTEMWKNLNKSEQLPLPHQLKKYITNYPYPV